MKSKSKDFHYRPQSFLSNLKKEAMEHVFLRCQIAVQVWSLSPLPLQTTSLQLQNLGNLNMRVGEDVFAQLILIN